MSELDLKELRRLAEAAKAYEERCAVDEDYRRYGCGVRVMADLEGEPVASYNIEHVAPEILAGAVGRHSVVLALLDRLEAAEGKLELAHQVLPVRWWLAIHDAWARRRL